MIKEPKVSPVSRWKWGEGNMVRRDVKGATGQERPWEDSVVVQVDVDFLGRAASNTLGAEKAYRRGRTMIVYGKELVSCRKRPAERHAR